MDISTIKEQVYHEQSFRTPLADERKTGLWVDRIGEKIDIKTIPNLRILGQYAAVAIMEGQGVFETAAFGKVSVGAGDVMLLFPDEPARYYPDQKWRETWVVWNGPEADILVEMGYLSREKLVLTNSANAVSTAFAKLSYLVKNEDIGAILERKAVLIDMILALFRAGNEDSSPSQSARAIQEVAAYAADNCQRQMEIEQLAAIANMSETHFHRLFRKYTGRSPRQFITACRINKAKELLDRGMPIKQVCSAVGYNDVFYFMRVFKNTAGVSCGNFRQGHGRG